MRELPSGIYYISFGTYGICKASGDGTKWLQGIDKIPKGELGVQTYVFN
jgi:hypothetical protein